MKQSYLCDILRGAVDLLLKERKCCLYSLLCVHDSVKVKSKIINQGLSSCHCITVDRERKKHTYNITCCLFVMIITYSSTHLALRARTSAC